MSGGVVALLLLASACVGLVSSAEVSWEKGFNYYPGPDGWMTLWEQYPRLEPRIDHHLGMMKEEMGSTIIRTFAHYSLFRNHDGKCNQTSLRSLRRFLDLCQDHGLRVVLSLFDGDPAQYQHDAQAAAEHIGCYFDHSALWAIDLRNEMDLIPGWYDCNKTTCFWQQEALDWMHLVYRAIRKAFGEDARVSISCTVDPRTLTELCGDWQLPGFYPQYHEYNQPHGGDMEAFKRVLHEDLNAIYKGCGRPFYMGEFGHSTLEGGDEAQLDFYEAWVEVLREHVAAGHVNAVTPWCLTDYAIDDLREANFGLLRSRDPKPTWKPAAFVLQKFFAEHIPPA